MRIVEYQNFLNDGDILLNKLWRKIRTISIKKYKNKFCRKNMKNINIKNIKIKLVK